MVPVAIKGADVLHVGNKLLLERAQTAGPGTVNLSPQKVYELGNYFSVATVFDIPDIAFSVDSYDCSTALESILTNGAAGLGYVTQNPLVEIAGGGTFASGSTFYYVVVATDTVGHSAPSNEQYIIVATPNDSVQVSWDTVADASAYSVYRGTAPGAENELLTSGATGTSYTDTGAAGTAATPAKTDTSGSALGTSFDLSQSYPLDVISQFKPGRLATSPYNIVASVGLPYLVLESMSYKFGLKNDAAQTASLRGDSIFYNPGSAYQESFAGTGAAGQVVTPAHNVFPFTGNFLNGTQYVTGVKTRSGTRLFVGKDYTESAVADSAADGGYAVSLTILKSVATTDFIDIIYSSPTAASYPQSVHTPSETVKPAAIRGRDITVYVGGVAITDKWSGVQSVQVDWKVTLDRNEEFGNYQLVSQDFFVPDVTGNIVVRPRDPQELLQRVQQAANVTVDTQVVGALQNVPLDVLIVLHSPFDGTALKTLEIPDARITIPAYSAKVQAKVDVQFDIQSDTGKFYVYHGSKPGGPS